MKRVSALVRVSSPETSLAASEADSSPVTREIGRALIISSVPIISKLGAGDCLMVETASFELGLDTRKSGRIRALVEGEPSFFPSVLVTSSSFSLSWSMTRYSSPDSFGTFGVSCSDSEIRCSEVIVTEGSEEESFLNRIA